MSNESKPNQKTLSSQTTFGLLVLALFIFGITASVLITLQLSGTKQPVYTIDVDFIMQEKLKSVRSQLNDVPGEELVRLSKQWAIQLDQIVTNMTQQHNAIVLARPAVIAGAEDLTQYVLNQLSPNQANPLPQTVIGQ